MCLNLWLHLLINDHKITHALKKTKVHRKHSKFKKLSTHFEDKTTLFTQLPAINLRKSGYHSSDIRICVKVVGESIILLFHPLFHYY